MRAAILTGAAGLTGVAHAGTINTAALQKADAAFFAASYVVTGQTSKVRTLVTFCIRANGGDRCEATVTTP